MGMPLRATGIGTWKTVLNTFSNVAVITNLYLYIFKTDQLECYRGCSKNQSTIEYCTRYTRTSDLTNMGTSEMGWAELQEIEFKSCDELYGAGGYMDIDTLKIYCFCGAIAAIFALRELADLCKRYERTWVTEFLRRQNECEKYLVTKEVAVQE